jgi:superfamily II DNA or RNA helicase
VLPPDGDPDVLLLRPLGGTDDDATGLYLPLEGGDVESASLPPPDPAHAGDAVSAALLRDAVRLGFRSAAGPLRCLGRIAVQPRPYQLVPLLMALKQDPVRLLIGDDVGIGKTIEAGLIARELLDRGEIARLCVLCSPQLCEQWQAELAAKFYVEAAVVRPGTVAALERELERAGTSLLTDSLFDHYPFTVVSIDYIKGDRRRADFLRACPELVIVDEAHTVAEPGLRSGAQHQRHGLVAELAARPDRHVILATATPHSGDQAAFGSLIGLLAPDLEPAVANLEFGAGSEARARLASHFVQRRRGDIVHYLDAETDFPERLTAEQTYKLTPEYRALLQRVLDHARELVKSAEGGSAFQRRVSWWAALALLRCVGSSPAAAAAALRSRAPRPDNADAAAVDRLGAATVLDVEQSDEAAGDDSTPGADTEDDTGDRAALVRLARQAESLQGAGDPKLAQAEAIVRQLLDAGFQPIVFCRYIATARYVAAELQRRLRGATVAAVTGDLPPEQREQQVAELARAGKPVLVATDCLSEGINLQHAFNAVVHYDLAWNPTRHEQREGRVDRYGQSSRQVRTVLLYGEDNRVDGVVLEVLLRKAERIRKSLGVSVPVPTDTEKVLEAIFDKLFDSRASDLRQLELFASEQQRQLDELWDQAEERERRTHTVFAQERLKPDEVRAELDQARAAIGSDGDVRRFMEDALSAVSRGGAAAETDVLEVDLDRLPAGVTGRLAGQSEGTLRVTFDPAAPKGVTYVGRTHPLVEALGGWLLDTALDQPAEAPARRCGGIRTAAVAERTVLLVLRGRYVIREQRPDGPRELLGEEALLAAFRGQPDASVWLPQDEAEELARAVPSANVHPEQRAGWLRAVLAGLPQLQPQLDALANARAAELLAAHRRVRQAARQSAGSQQVEAKLPLDLLGLYVLMPPPAA